MNPCSAQETQALTNEDEQNRERAASIQADSAPIPPDLECVIDAWPDLPGSAKQTIIAIVDAYSAR